MKDTQKTQNNEEMLKNKLDAMELKLELLFSYIGLKYEKVEAVEEHHRVVRRQ